MQARISGYANGIVAQADRICCHSFDVLGYKEFDYGSPINWHLNAIHGKETPRYLDFDEVGDSKVIWKINRHQHLVTLAKAIASRANNGTLTKFCANGGIAVLTIPIRSASIGRAAPKQRFAVWRGFGPTTC